MPINIVFFYERDKLNRYLKKLPIVGKTIKDIKCLGVPKYLKEYEKKQTFVDMYNNEIANGYTIPLRKAVTIEDIPDDLPRNCATVFEVLHIIFDDNSTLIIDNSHDQPSALGFAYVPEIPKTRRKEQLDATQLFDKMIGLKIEGLMLDKIKSEQQLMYVKKGIKKPYGILFFYLENNKMFDADWSGIRLFADRNFRFEQKLFSEIKKIYFNIEEHFSSEPIEYPSLLHNPPTTTELELVEVLEGISKYHSFVSGILNYVITAEERQFLLDLIKYSDKKPSSDSIHIIALLIAKSRQDTKEGIESKAIEKLNELKALVTSVKKERLE